MEYYDYFVEDETSKLFGNATTLICSAISSDADGSQERFRCVRYNYWHQILTLLFIYLPSMNVIATLFGRTKAAWVGLKFSLMMVIIGGTMALVGFFLAIPSVSIAGWYIVIIYLGVMGSAWQIVNFFAPGSYLHHNDASIYYYIIFLPLFIISPAIFLFIKILAILKAGNSFIQDQASFGSRGESIFEAAPQLGLQLYVAMLSLNPSITQILSMITSSATLSLPNIQLYVTEKGEVFGKKSIINNLLVFLPASLFKISALSILAVFIRGWLVLVIAGTILIVWVSLFVISQTLDLKFNEGSIDVLLLSWLTLASLKDSKIASMERMWSTLIVTTIYSIILVTIIIICYVDPNSVFIHGFDLNWSDLELVKKPLYLNLFLGLTIGIGWASFLLDVVNALCRTYICGANSEDLMDAQDTNTGFWNRAVLLEVFKWKDWNKQQNLEETKL